jgi:hypothetical protein
LWVDAVRGVLLVSFLIGICSNQVNIFLSHQALKRLAAPVLGGVEVNGMSLKGKYVRACVFRSSGAGGTFPLQPGISMPGDMDNVNYLRPEWTVSFAY